MGMTNAFFNEITGLMGGIGSKAAFGYMALGTSATAFAATQTALLGEITDSGLERAAVTPTQVTDVVANNTLQFVKAFAATGAKAVNEAAILNAATVGTMACRTVLPATRNLVGGDTYTATYKIKAV